MALSIRAVSKAERVDCKGYPDGKPDECCDHYEVASLPLGREGLKVGCYVTGRGGRSFSFEIGYSDYARWFDELYRLVYGLDAKGVCGRFRRHRRKPFLELLDVGSTSDGQAIGPRTSAKLFGDFVAFAGRAGKYFTQDADLAWMWEVYRDFRRALRIASDDGFVAYW